MKSARAHCVTVQASQLAMGQLAQQLTQQATLLTGVEFFRLLMWAGAACAGLMCVQRTLK
jgi:MFS transporter, DHA2 family, multidrug resistance protein